MPKITKKYRKTSKKSFSIKISPTFTLKIYPIKIQPKNPKNPHPRVVKTVQTSQNSIEKKIAKPVLKRTDRRTLGRSLTPEFWQFIHPVAGRV